MCHEGIIDEVERESHITSLRAEARHGTPHAAFTDCGGGGLFMGCFPALLARVALFAAWVATRWVGNAFHGGIGGWLLPLLGLFFLPVTTLAYVVVYALGNGVAGGGWLWIVLALFFDIAMHSSAARANRHRIKRFTRLGDTQSA
jgi:hypothetical protein